MLSIIAPLMKAQHDEILKVFSEYDALLSQKESEQRTEKMKQILHELARRLTIHLAQEDCLLYPALTQSENIAHQELAEQFTSEMGGMADRFDAFANHWRLGNTIQENEQAFQAESKEILAALRSRIQREEREIFPLIKV
ncbi:MAG: hemerythrin domain-containing protein [Magnetococcales bacterium]|nr:hemerythrin domain-containing protein [Magnetococcales bacterium]